MADYQQDGFACCMLVEFFCTRWNFKIAELLGHTVVVITLILLSTWDPLNNFSFSQPLARIKMTKTCLQKENTYQSLTRKSSLSSPQPFHTVENYLTETHNLNRNAYVYMDLRVGPYERKVEGNISGEKYPIRDIPMSDQEWGGPQRCKKNGTKIEYAQDTPFSLIFFWCARRFRPITRVSAQFWGHFSYSCVLVALSRAGCRWGRIAGDSSLISARKARLMQERAGDLLRNHYGKLDIWKLSLWMRQERGKERNWSCELG